MLADKAMRRGIRPLGLFLSLAAACALPCLPAFAFCGFYVAQADSKLFNKASKVVLAFDSGRTTITMASDYEGDPKSFALVVPVPTIVKEQDIRTVDNQLLDKIDAYSAPRLTEYYDTDPCSPPPVAAATIMPAAPGPHILFRSSPRKDLGVTIEARYAVGVYDILILSAKESDGLVEWLSLNKYHIPPGAGPVLGSYIRQNMHFFVAKVNLDRQKQASDHFLSPLQVSYVSSKFMLPIRLGTVNANGPQDLVVFALTRKGRVETTNYQTAKMTSDIGLPLFSQGEFGSIYKAAFDRRVALDHMNKIYLEYAWDMRGFSPCDPCAAPVPTAVDLFALGARWHYPQYANATVDALKSAHFPFASPDAFITRLHVRYDSAHFPEDLSLMETGDSETFQVVYKLTHPAEAGTCREGLIYKQSLPARFAGEAQALADLTGWQLPTIRQKMIASGEPFP